MSRDFWKEPYSPAEIRVMDYLRTTFQVMFFADEQLDDPVGKLIEDHRELLEENIDLLIHKHGRE